MQEDRRRWIWGDEQTPTKATTSRRGSSTVYGLLTNPNAACIYKPWLDAQFVKEMGGRQEMSQWLTEHEFEYKRTKRTKPIPFRSSNLWGATHEVSVELEFLIQRPSHR